MTSTLSNEAELTPSEAGAVAETSRAGASCADREVKRKCPGRFPSEALAAWDQFGDGNPAVSFEAITEIELARQLGVSRADLKNLRRGFDEGADWYCTPGEPVMITPSGQEKVQAALKALDGDGSPKKISGAVAAAVVRASRHVEAYRLVVRRRCLNKKMLVATDGMQNVRCRVRDNGNYKIGMVLEGCRRDGPTLFTYQGRTPRRRGKF